jgi:ectoine hydroxylase
MSQIKEIIRRFKPIYIVNNVLNYNRIANSKELYSEFGLRKNKVSKISSRDFEGIESEKPWLDQFDSAELLPKHNHFQRLSPLHKKSLLEWSKNGYAVLDSFIKDEEIDQINAFVDQMVEERSAQFKYDHSLRIMNAVRTNNELKSIACSEKLELILSMLLGKSVSNFQSINFLKGSEQKAHSDSIHMTTFPLGYLIAVWIALEDVNEDQGPLFIYPESHQLDYVLTDDFNNEGNYLFFNKNAYHNYEAAIENIIEVNNFQRKAAKMKKGDIIIWHANLLHGGAKIKDSDATRKSMALHYFADDVIKYHEITQRPAID